MNSTVLTFNGSGDVTEEEVIHNPIPYVKEAMENNHRFNPLFPFHTPFRLIVAGPSGAGKIEFVQRLIKESALMMRQTYTRHHYLVLFRTSILV